MTKLGCQEIDPNNVDFKNPRSILKGLLNLFKIPRSLPSFIPKELILASKTRPGMSPSLIASRIIERQADAGLPVGPLPNGEVAPGELMERIRVEEIVKAITTEMRIDVAVQPGTITSSVQGFAGPIPVVGTAVQASVGGGSAIAS